MPLPVLIIPLLSLLAMILTLIASWQFQNLDPKKHFFTSRLTSILQKISHTLSPHVRLYTFLISAVWAIAVFLYFYLTSDISNLPKNLVRAYGFTALFYLFAALTPGMLRVYFPAFILDSLLIKARRAIGISMFLFALTHGLMAYIFYFSFSFDKVLSSPQNYQIAFYFAVAALSIFSVMAITSFDKVVGALGFRKWKFIHRFIYLAFLLSLLHTFIRGTHLNQPYITFSAFMVFLALDFILLEIGSTAIYVINHTYAKSRLKSYIIFIILALIGFAAFYLSLIKLEQLYK